MQRHWIWALAVAFAAACGLTLAVRGGRWAASHLGGTIGGAQWIWVAHDRRQAQPLAFYAARDFRLAAPPARARLLALGDQEYVLYLNGKRVGAGRWRPGARLDAYEVGALLRPGANRLLAELRSDDGGGGFLASLVDEASGRALVGTDGAWRTFRRHRLGLVRGWLPVDAANGLAAVSAAGPGEAAVCWGRPPVGRWGRVVPAWPRPLFAELTGGGRPVTAAGATPYTPPPATRVRGDRSMVLFDWGREVTGYLALETGFEAGMDSELAQAPPDHQRTALLWTGDAPPQPAGTGLEPSGEVVLMASAHQWLDARPRRFRYALVIGLERPLAARVYAVDPGIVARAGMEIRTGPESGEAALGLGRATPPRGSARLTGPRGYVTPNPRGEAGGTDRATPLRGESDRATPLRGESDRATPLRGESDRATPLRGESDWATPLRGESDRATPLRGVFGLAPPRLRSPVENEIRRKLESLESVAGRKDL